MKTQHLSKAEMNGLAVAAKEGNVPAQNRLIESNMGLIRREANRIAGACNTPVEDLIGWGVVGMIQGIQAYNPDKGVKFTTHSVYWIKAEMMARSMADRRIVKIGTAEYQRKVYWALSRESAKLRAKGLEVTNEVLAERIPGTTPNQIAEMRGRLAGGSERSLASTVGDEGQTLFDTIADPTAVNPEVYSTEAAESAWMRARMEEFSARLNPTEKVVWDYRIDTSDKPLPGREVGRLAGGLSRQRVDQIEKDLLARFTRFARAGRKDLDD